MAQDNNTENTQNRPGVMRIVYGVFMIVIYIGMGILLLSNVFNEVIPIQWIRIVLAVSFIIYGIWRAYRQFSNRF